MRLLYNICVVGCGGTGSYVLTGLCRFLSIFQVGKEETIVRVTIVDGDRVEEKNLDRQAFITDDIGSFKAVCFKEAIRECFPNVSVKAYPEYLVDVKRLTEIMDGEYAEVKALSYKKTSRIDILVGCVDNHRARQVMLKYFRKTRDIFWIDSANEYEKGEVVTGIKAKGKVLSPDRTFYFPEVARSREKRADQISCTAVNASSPQHILTNQLAAQVTLSKIVPILEKSPFALNGGITYFDAFRGEMMTKGGRDAIKERIA